MPRAEEWLAHRGMTPSNRRRDEPAKSNSTTVTTALQFIRRSTARTPQSSARIREKLLARGIADEVADDAIAAATASGELDDAAFAEALVNDWFDRGHAPRRISYDLRRRGFTDSQIATAMSAHLARHDPYAAAFAVAMDRAAPLLALPTETALRRLTGHVQRRGYSSGVAVKAARDALYAARQTIDSAEA